MSLRQKIIALSGRFASAATTCNVNHVHKPARLMVNNYSASAANATTSAGPKLTMTSSCVKQLKQVLDEPDQFLRVMVEGGGCSGFSYKFDIDTTVQDDDSVFESDGVRIVADEMSLELIGGSEVDYVEELIRSAFVIKNNPQSSNQCSCGVSFAIDL